MKPQFAIVNDTDRPYERLVAQNINGKYYYMNRATEKSLKEYVMEPERPMDMRRFGFVITLLPGGVNFKRVNPNTASYADLKPREWQGEGEFTLPYVILTIEELRKK